MKRLLMLVCTTVAIFLLVLAGCRTDADPHARETVEINPRSVHAGIVERFARRAECQRDDLQLPRLLRLDFDRRGDRQAVGHAIGRRQPPDTADSLADRAPDRLAVVPHRGDHADAGDHNRVRGIGG